ncbi:hypothetical protein PtB15_1B460 [Puccinia triticina]|nr:hypothetical protein PtB15_1B460 [Puccinia triticina]
MALLSTRLGGCSPPARLPCLLVLRRNALAPAGYNKRLPPKLAALPTLRVPRRSYPPLAVPMEIPSRPASERASSPTRKPPRPMLSVRRRSASLDSSDPSDPSSPKSSRYSCAGTTAVDVPTRQPSATEHPLRHELPGSSTSDGGKPKKTSYAWRKTLYEYFKSDDEGILTSDDEHWLGSNKPYAAKQEPPSGKTRLPKELTPPVADTEASPDSDFEDRSDDQPSPPPSPHLTPSSPIRPSPASPKFTPSDFPALSANPRPVSVSDSLACQLPDGPWKNPTRKPSATQFPALNSPARPPPSHPATRFICSFSSAVGRAAHQPDPSAALAQEKAAKIAEAVRREETLKATLPAFELDDPACGPQKIIQCPSDQHPISELPQLIKTLCTDGISLPCGRAELEGGPYVAVAFDMEWTISRTRGHENRTAVLQLASRSQVLIVQISREPGWRTQGIIPPSLLDFLVNPQIVKIGVGIRNDGLKLIRDHKLGPKPFLNSFLELSRLVRALGQPDCASGYSRLISLQQIVADHLKLYLPKPDTRTSDWTKPLSDTQIHYAASDVMATIRVAMHLFKLFEGRIRRTDSGLMILQYIESLEPTYDRSAPPPQAPKPPTPVGPYSSVAQPPPKPRVLVLTHPKDAPKPKAAAAALPKAKWPGPAPIKRKQWRTLVPAQGPQSVEVKKKWVVQAPTFLAPALVGLKTRVSPAVLKSWQLWYHEGHAINQCAKLLEVSSVTFATNLGKMLVHLKLNDLSLDEYYERWIRARRADPQAFQELGASIKRLCDDEDVKETTMTDCAGCNGADLAAPAVDQISPDAVQTQERPESPGNRADQPDLTGEQIISRDVDQAEEPLERNEGPDDQGLEDLPAAQERSESLGTRGDQAASADEQRCRDGDQAQERSERKEGLDDQGLEASPAAAEAGLPNVSGPQTPPAPSSSEQAVDGGPAGVEPPPSAANTPAEQASPAGKNTSLVGASLEPGENVQDGGQPATSWFEESEKLVAGHVPPASDATDGSGKAAAPDGGACAGAEKKGEAQMKTMNFAIDDGPFLAPPAEHSAFDAAQRARVRAFNAAKAQLIDAFVSGFGLPKRLRTSPNYFQFR